MSIMKKTMDFFIHTKDVDFKDRIKPSAVLDMFQDIAGIHASELGLGYEVFKEKGYAWVVLYQQFTLIKLPPYLKKVYLSTWPKQKNRLEFEREYLLKDDRNEILGYGISNWVIMNLETRSLLRSDKIDFAGEYESFTNYPQKCKRKLNLEPRMDTDVFSYQVKIEDLDHNGHMNNARYLALIENRLLKENAKDFIYQVEIAYCKEAKYEDMIMIHHYKIENKDAFIGFLEEEKCFECLVERKEL